MVGKKSYILRSLGYLALPDVFKKMFGVNSKKKERLKILPEPVNVEFKPFQDDGTTSITYTWSNEELDKYRKEVLQ